MNVVRVLLAAAGLVLLVLFLLWLPIDPQFESQPQPAQSFEEALARAAQLQARDTAELFPECHSALLHHDQPVQQSIVFLHGITNCPAQFAVLGRRFYDLGYNVLIPRLPHHGVADPMSPAIAQLTAEELVATADEAVDIAAGLGEEVTVVGFSTGGTVAAWVAGHRPDADRTVLLSPFLSPKAYPAWLIRPLMRVLLLMPNQFWWWNPALKEQTPGPRYAYPRYPTRAIAQVMRLSFAIRRQAQQEPPSSGEIVVVTNAGPRETVDNMVIAQLVAAWERQGATQITTFELPSSLDLEHNYVDPDSPNQPVDLAQVVHPLLIEQIRGRAATTP